MPRGGRPPGWRACAAIELARGKPERAVLALKDAVPYQQGGIAALWVPYLRGQALLGLSNGVEAAREFQKALDQRKLQPRSPLWALSHLGLARAHALAKDTAKSRRAYQDFFALWKDADPDIPVRREARQEYETAAGR